MDERLPHNGPLVSSPAALVAAVLWSKSAAIKVPNNIDAVPDLQRIGFWNAWAAGWSCLTASDVASLHDQPVAETVDNARRQQGPTKGIRNGGPHRRGISGDMMRTTACQLERPSTPGGRNPAEETLPITVSGKWKGRRQGVGSGHKVPLMGVQQNAPGGKGPDR